MQFFEYVTSLNFVSYCYSVMVLSAAFGSFRGASSHRPSTELQMPNGEERSQTCAWQRTDRLDQALVDVASKPNCILHCDCCQDQINNVCVRNRDGRWGDVDVEEDLGAP